MDPNYRSVQVPIAQNRFQQGARDILQTLLRAEVIVFYNYDAVQGMLEIRYNAPPAEENDADATSDGGQDQSNT